MIHQLQILRDAAARPELFFWNDAIPIEDLRSMIAAAGMVLPEDLFFLLSETGGGDIFETETILSPSGDKRLGDEIISTNEFLRERGLPKNFTVFHRGLCFSAVRINAPEYVTMDEDSFKVTGEYDSLDDWYTRTIRKEYGQAYKLT